MRDLNSYLDLGKVWNAGLLGVLLGVFVVVVGGAVLLGADKLTRGNGVAGLAAASTAGNAAVVPAIVAGANSAYGSSAPSATVLVAASVVVTSVLCPVVVSLWVRLRVPDVGRPRPTGTVDDPQLPAEDYRADGKPTVAASAARTEKFMTKEQR